MLETQPRRSAGQAVTLVRHAAGFLELAGRFGAEITTLVQEVHAASSPLAWIVGNKHPARVVYGSLRVGFETASRLSALGGRLTPADPRSDGWLDVQSAVNGAFGHLLAASGEQRGGFSLPMSLRRRSGEAPAKRMLVFLHGLCMNERGWRGRAHVEFSEWVRGTLGAEVAYLRYNTGLRISTNGATLATLLEREPTLRELILVGHSMGGLVARSALHQARAQGMAWPKKLRALACIGTPHEGASWERLGNHANRLLGLSSWTRPFMRLGNLRSDGIHDLRFGDLLEEDWRDRPRHHARPCSTAAPWADDIDHLLVAALRRGGSERDALGDWLVPVESAWARNIPRGANARRELVRDLDHLGLLVDGRVYQILRGWLSERIAAD